MRKFNNHQSGFGVVGVLAIAIVVLVIGGASYVIFHKSSSSKSAAVTPPSVVTPATPTPSVATTSEQSAQQYLTISEWGVTAPYNSNNGDMLTYTLSSDKKTANLGSKLLTSKDPACTDGGAGVVQRFAADDSAEIAGDKTAAQLAKENPNRYVFVNGYYYQYMHAQGACGSTSITDQNQANNLAQSAIAKLQASK